VTRLTGLTSLDLGSNELSADDGAYVCGAVAAGMPVLQKLSLLGNGFNCSAVVDCHEWRTLGLPQPPDEVVRQGFDSLLQYLLSENKVATNAIRIFVVGESTVRCFQVFGLYARCAELYCFSDYFVVLSYNVMLVCCAVVLPLISCIVDGQNVARARAHVFFVHMRAHRP
jgi:hypothetical protein